LLLGQFLVILPEARAWTDRHSGFNDLVQDTVYLLAVLLLATRAIVVRQDRGAWLLMAGGLSC
jgi:diguanylate cyclase